jgi:uncharacterized protein (DUF4415 family)
MSRPPTRNRGPLGAREVAEAAFRSTTTKPVEGPTVPPALPTVKELVSIRIDQDVLEHFQSDGPGWQDRINEVLRKAAGKAPR